MLSAFLRRRGLAWKHRAVRVTRALKVQHTWLGTKRSVEYWSMLVAGSHCAHICE